MPTTPLKGYEIQATGANVGTWGAVLNADALALVDTNMGGIVTKALASSNVTLSTTEARNLVVRLTGTITTNIVITNPNIGFYYVENATTGSFTVTITNGVGTAVECPQGYTVAIIADSTNGCRRGNNAPGSVFGASGGSHSTGLVPDPGATAGTTKYLREDSSFQIPPFQFIPGGRLSLDASAPVTTSNVTGASTVYYTGVAGSIVPVWNGSALVPISITGNQLTLTLNNPNHAANTNYDVFFFLDGSTPRIGTGPPWSTPTSRGTGAGTTQLQLLAGIYANAVSITARNGATTYAVSGGLATYVGTIRTSSTAGQTEDSSSNRFVFNAYHQMRRFLQVNDNTNSWSYTSQTVWRQANASTANQFGVLFGLEGHAPRFDVAVSMVSEGSGNRCAVGIGIDSTTVNSSQLFGGTSSSAGVPASAHYVGYPGIGYHAIAWLEIGIVTFRGDDGLSFLTSGMVGEVWA